MLKKYKLIAKSVALLMSPPCIKPFLLRLMGHKIGNNVYIGFSIIIANKIEIDDNAYIGHFNIFKFIDTLRMGDSSRINKWNIFTSDFNYSGSIYVGANSSISLRHYFDLGANIIIGDNVVIAGHYTSFFTHGISPNKFHYTNDINIGEWCYIGSNCLFVPGALISDHSFVAMGTRVTKKHNIPYSIIGNQSSVEIDTINPDAIYYNSGPLVQIHRR